jgi:hypothetical protein
VGWRCAGDGSYPKLFAGRPDGELAIGREPHIFATFFVAAHLAQGPRGFAVNLHGKDHLLAWRKVVGGGGDPSRLIGFGAADVDNSTAVGREAQACYGFAVVSAVVRDLPRRKGGAVGHPDVARTFGIEHPCNARRMRRGHESVWKRRAQHLFEGEGSGESRNSGGDEQHKKRDAATSVRGHGATAYSKETAYAKRDAGASDSGTFCARGT